jgi:tetratricopeptide (TPR) repeat protein
MAAALATTLPASAKGARARDPCFFEFAQPDERIAACTALIHSGVAGITAALLSRAGAFGQIGDYEHAVEDATQVIALAPSSVAYYTRALAYHDDGDDMRAITDCDAALGMQSDNANALFVRGAAYQGFAAYSEAIRDFTKVLKLDPKRVEARFSRGAARYSAGQYEGAVKEPIRRRCASSLKARCGVASRPTAS